MRAKLVDYEARVKSAGADSGQFEAIVAAYNVDSVGDRIIPGAFEGTLGRWKASGNRLPVIWSHQWNDPDYHVGYVLEAAERPSEGLWVRGQLDLDAPKAAQVFRLLKGRRVTQFSFAYDVLDERRAKDANELLELDLLEVGPTLIGANRETRLLAAKAASRHCGRLTPTAARLAAAIEALDAGLDDLAAELLRPR